MMYFSDDPDWMLDHLDLHGRVDLHLFSFMWRGEVYLRTYDSYLRKSHSWGFDDSTDEFVWCYTYTPHNARLKFHPEILHVGEYDIDDWVE